MVEEEAGKAPGERRGRVLVVDDDPGVLEAIRLILEFNGYTVLAVSEGAEALELYRKSCEGIDLVITDIMMPAMNGSGLIAALRKRNPAVKIIVVSGLAAGSPVSPFPELGGAKLLPKPFTGTQLCDAVEMVLRCDPRVN